jgi:chromosome segregation ATPase
MDIRDIEEIQQLRERLHQMKCEHEEALQELRESKLNQSLKSEKLKEALNKLESTDKELMVALTENNKLKKQNSELNLDSQKLTKKLQRLEEENRRLSDKYEKNEENLVKLQDEHHFMSKKLTGYSKDYSAVNEQYEDSLKEISRLRDVERLGRIALDDLKDLFKNLIKNFSRFAKKLSPSTSQYLISFDKISETLRRVEREKVDQPGFREDRDSKLEAENAFQDLFSLLISDLEVL